MFRIDHLDHVAITVRDLEVSINWYQEILGLTKLQPNEWKPWPIFMVSGETGVALFPGKVDIKSSIEHFAFRVSPQEFEKAKIHLKNYGIEYETQDHTYFLSVYFKDPDNHIVELTTQIKKFQ